MSRVHRHRLSRQRVLQLLGAALCNGYVLGFSKGRIFTGGSKAFCVPVLNCYSCPGALGACPIGALQSAIGGRGGRFPFYVLGTLVLFGAVLGRAACGLLCPFGLVQDLLHKIPVPKRRVPRRLDRPARYIKYAVLLCLVAALPVLSRYGTPYFCKYLCPAGTLEGGIPLLLADPSLRQAAGGLFGWKLAVLAAIVGLSAVVHRPFCKYLCPLGAFYSLFHRFGLYRLRLDAEKCTGCGLCERACPMEVDVRRDLNGRECIQCGQCRSVCPAGAVSGGFRARRRASSK